MKLVFYLIIAKVFNDWLCPQARYWLILVALSINIPGISVLCVLEERLYSLFANIAVFTSTMYLNVRKIAIFLALFIKFIIDKAVIETHLEVCWEAIKLPVGQTIRYNLAFKIRYPGIWIFSFCVNNPKIKGCHQERYYDSSMLLT